MFHLPQKARHALISFRHLAPPLRAIPVPARQKPSPPCAPPLAASPGWSAAGNCYEMPPLRAATISHSPHTLCDTCPRSGLLPSLTRHYPESRDSAALESSTQGVKAASRGPLVCAPFF